MSCRVFSDALISARPQGRLPAGMIFCAAMICPWLVPVACGSGRLRLFSFYKMLFSKQIPLVQRFCAPAPGGCCLERAFAGYAGKYRPSTRSTKWVSTEKRQTANAAIGSSAAAIDAVSGTREKKGWNASIATRNPVAIV